MKAINQINPYQLGYIRGDNIYMQGCNLAPLSNICSCLSIFLSTHIWSTFGEPRGQWVDQTSEASIFHSPASPNPI